MSWKLSAGLGQDRNASLAATFAYEENIVYPTSPDPKDQKASDEAVNAKKKERQIQAQVTIVNFLRNRYNVSGFRYFSQSDNNFFATNSQDTGMTQPEKRYDMQSRGTNYRVEIHGQLKPGEHLDEMLDCDSLDTLLSKLFEEKQ